MNFELKSNFGPAGDQPRAISELSRKLEKGSENQTLLGVTGSGKTFTVANVIRNHGQPTLVISHNKTLAAQLYYELKNFFPKNAVHYFVSYYDYYQPEAYLPQSDTYIEKDAKINEEIDRLRHGATQALLTRNDVIIVASVSCIYGIGNPEEYKNMSLEIFRGQEISRQKLLWRLASLQYRRNDFAPKEGEFEVKGELIRVYPVTGDEVMEIELFGNQIEALASQSPDLPQKRKTEKAIIYPAKHFVTPKDKLEQAIKNIKLELSQRLKEFQKNKKYLEYQRLRERTNYDLAMLKETGYVTGIENYSRHLSFRSPDEAPFTLLDYFRYAAGNDFLTVIDESHMTIPQIRGMFEGDRSRKRTLVEHGFRLPSALDNRPLRFEEFNQKIGPAIYASATPGRYETQKSGRVTEQLIRPTGLLEPEIKILPTNNQIPKLIEEIKKRVSKKERALVTTITKRLAEELTEHLANEDINVKYLHSDIKTFDRSEVLTDLRKGKIDAVVGINLLREGLDLPEVSLVAILDADKEGFLRNEITLVQTVGRAARHPQGKAILFADKMTNSLKNAVREARRRRRAQKEHNAENNIVPRAIKKKIAPMFAGLQKKKKQVFRIPAAVESLPAHEKIEWLHKEMKKSSDNLEFEKAAFLRDRIRRTGNR